LTKEFDIWLDAIDNATVMSPGPQTHINGAHLDAPNGVPASFGGIAFPISLSGPWTVALAGTTRITLALRSTTLSGGDLFRIWPGFNISVVRFPA
jgi:hypothetical protein